MNSTIRCLSGSCRVWIFAIGLLLGWQGRSASGDNVATGQAPANPGDAAVMRALAMTDWLYEVESVQVHATIMTRRPQDAVDAKRPQYVKEYPGFTDEDLGKIDSLKTRSTARLEWAWDRRRASFRASHHEWLDEDFIWDGSQAIVHFDWKVLRDNSFAILLRPTRTLTNDYFGWLPWAWFGHSSPRQTAGLFEAGGREAREKALEEYRTLVRHSEVVFDGVPCDLYWRPVAGDWDHFYIDRATGRIRGKRVGSWGIEFRRLWAPLLAQELRKRGHDVMDAAAESTWKALSQELQREVDESIRSELDASYRAHFDELDSIWMATFSDWREVRPGCFFPFQQILEESRLTAGKAVAEAETRTITIDSITLDEPLPDSLFEVPVVEGARVYDETLGFPVSYTQDKNRTKEEWDAILDKARTTHEETIREKQSLDELIGTQAAEFPSDGWLNSEPLTWEGLKGQYVILDFWHVGCGPCQQSVAWMQAMHRNQEEGLAVIGVHGAGVAIEDVKAACKDRFKIDLSFPICVDAAVDDKEAAHKTYPSALFQAYRVGRMPYAWLVGPDGKLIAHGDIEKMVDETRKRIRAK